MKYYPLPGADGNFSFTSWLNGSYWGNSPNLVDQFGQVNMVQLQHSVVEHLKLILATWLGEIGQLPTYGNPLFYIKFHQAALKDPHFKGQLRTQLTRVIEAHETRLINVQITDFSHELSTLFVHVQGQLRVIDSFGMARTSNFQPGGIPFPLT